MRNSYNMNNDTIIWKWKILKKKVFTTLFSHAVHLYDDKKYTAVVHHIIFGKQIRLEPPCTYNEHLSALKLQDKYLEYSQYADKYEVRNYVKGVIGESFLNPVLGIFDSYDEIPFDELPEQFAIKCTHGSSYNIIVSDKKELNHKKARRKINRWLNENYYFQMREKQYKNIKPRIMIDKFLKQKDGNPLNEVKLYCIDGIVRFIVDNHENELVRYSNMYTRDWEWRDVSCGFPVNPSFSKPENGDELVRIAEILAKPFKFVRVDLYNVDGKILFSELTFCPAGGMTLFNPESFDDEMGIYFNSNGECI